MSRTLKNLGIEIPPEEDTPLVRRLVAIIEQLAAEVERLKGLPETPHRPASPSPLNDDSKPPSQQKPNRKGKKRPRPKGHKRSKFQQMQFDETKILQPAEIPDGARLRGYKCFHQQELKLECVNIRYKRAVYELPDGSRLTGPRPDHLQGHFGPTLRSYILYQYYHNQVTEPLLLEWLRELGFSISAGQISRILTEGHETFHAEKDALLPAAREVSSYFQTDDTGARHKGKNGHTLHIGNDLFASFFTTDSKSRINFLEVLRAPYDDYVLNGDALFYLEHYQFPKKKHRWLSEELGGHQWEWESAAQWEQQLDEWKIDQADHCRLLTEAALWGSLMAHDLYVHQPFISDDAAQFKLLGFAHALCWLHAERHVARLIPLDARQRKAYDTTRDAIWRYYQRLKRYRENPSRRAKARLAKDFNRLFLAKSGWTELNNALRTIHAKKDELLLVLERPDIPLHNNLSENDIRQFAKLRKISGSSRSDNGRRCRDTFLSLKTTCRKRGISFWQYVMDRIHGWNQILPLPDIIRGSPRASPLT